VCRRKCLVPARDQELVDVHEDDFDITALHEKDDDYVSVCTVYSTIEFVECGKGVDARHVSEVGVLYAARTADDGRSDSSHG
jgi:hypothetical protein